MTTQYVMKATHINSPPLGIVYWVVSGSPDMSGLQSGYNPADLVSIAVDYTTSTNAPVSVGNLGGLASGDLAGNYPGPIVAKIQTRTVNSIAPTDGYVLTWVNADGYWAPKAPSGNPGGSNGDIQIRNGSLLVGLSPGSSGNIATSTGSAWISQAPSPISRLTSLDANHLHAWELTETSGNFLDTGSSLTPVNLTTSANAVYYSTPGLLGPCPLFGINPATGATHTSYAEGNVASFTDLPLTNNTMELWFRPLNSVFGFAGFTNSLGGANNWAFTDNSGAVDVLIMWTVTAGSGQGLNQISGSIKPIIGQQWHHIAITYDGANARFYLDGNLVQIRACTGNTLWANGTPLLRLNWNGSFAQGTNQMSRFRISNIARSAQYMKDVYNKGIGY